MLGDARSSAEGSAQSHSACRIFLSRLHVCQRNTMDRRNMNRTARIIILLTASLAGAAFSGSTEPQLMFHRCTVTGSTTSPLAQQRNILKNRFTTPTPADINPSITLAAILEPGKDVKRWSVKSAAEIEGTVFDVK